MKKCWQDWLHRAIAQTSGIGKTGLMSPNGKDKSLETQPVPLLLFLPNRERQKNQLRSTIRKYGEKQRPLLCLVVR